VARSIPQLLSLSAIVVGVLLFVVALFHIDLAETVESAGRLGFAFPLILLPGAIWQTLRTWGWSVAFPDTVRPAFTRLFRVRLAADALSYFTIRGLAGEPLKVVLLYDRAPPEVATAAVTLERVAFAVGSIVVAGLISAFAVTNLPLPRAWSTLFRLLSIGAALTVWLVVWLARQRSGDYLGRVIARLDRATGRRLEASRVIRFLLEVEDVLLALLRGGRKRLVVLSLLPVVCYLLTTIEVWLVFWAIGQPIGIAEGLAVETFARLASIASAAIPANVGALEASNAAVVDALGLAGGGSLALTRRVRSLIWAGLGLALYPRVQAKRHPESSPVDPDRK
jgi:uncharacterized protein (TIRG00374 family)